VVTTFRGSTSNPDLRAREVGPEIRKPQASNLVDTQSAATRQTNQDRIHPRVPRSRCLAGQVDSMAASSRRVRSWWHWRRAGWCASRWLRLGRIFVRPVSYLERRTPSSKNGPISRIFGPLLAVWKPPRVLFGVQLAGNVMIQSNSATGQVPRFPHAAGSADECTRSPNRCVRAM
jgi:hypothetical protein